MTTQRSDRDADGVAQNSGVAGWRPVDVRRAVLGMLLSAREPVRVADMVGALQQFFGGAIDSRRVSDVLRYQVRRGRVQRVGHGWYEAVAGSLPKATAWRCANWQREQIRRQQRRS